MTKSTITRERIQRIIRAINSEAYDEEEIREWLSSDEIMELSLMALAAMDGEHKRNPVLAYADSYRDMAKQGVESVQIWSVITDLERNIAPLYRHPQPAPVAPVVSADLLHTAASAIEDLLTTKDRTGAGVWFDLPFRLRSAANAQPVPLVPDKNGLLPCPFCGGEPEEDAGGCSEFHGHEHQDYSITCKQCGAEVYCSVGTFEKADVPCSCHHDTRKVCVDKWNRRAAMLAAAQHDTPALNPVQSVVTVPGKWIPVSERMPEVGVKVLCFPAEDEPIHAVFNGQLWLQDVSWSGSEEPIDNVIPVTVTHWMPLPAGPQEVR